MEVIFKEDNPHNQYKLLHALGRGASAIVFQGINRITKQEVAIKIILPDEDGDLNYYQVQTEISFLKEFSSPFIVSFIEGFKYEENIWIVLQYCAGGGIIDTCHILNILLSEEEIKHVMASVTLGINDIHSHGCIHRDLKASNILLTSDGTALLADFGVSARTTTFSKRKTVTGTPQFMSPEMIHGEGYGQETDMWSLGITLIELCEGEAPNKRGSMKKILSRTLSGPAPSVSNPSKWSPELIDFLEKCLVKEVSERASCSDLLQHPWIATIVQELEVKSSSEVLFQFFERHKDELLRLRDISSEQFRQDQSISKIMTAQKLADEQDLIRIQAEEAIAAEQARLKAEEDERIAIIARLRAEEEAKEMARLKEEKEAEEAAKLKAEEEAREFARLKAEEDARLKAKQEEEEKIARLRAKEEARKAKEEAEAERLKAEEEARLKAKQEEEAARLKAEKEAEEKLKAKQEEEERLKAEKEAEELARLKAKQEEEEKIAQLNAEEEIRKAEEARLKAKQEAEEEARLKAEELARLEEEARKAAEEAAKLKAKKEEEELARLKTKQEEEEAARLKAEKEAEELAHLKAKQQQQEEEQQQAERLKAEEEARKAAEEFARLKAEQEEEEKIAQLKAEEEARLREQEEKEQQESKDNKENDILKLSNESIQITSTEEKEEYKETQILENNSKVITESIDIDINIDVDSQPKSKTIPSFDLIPIPGVVVKTRNKSGEKVFLNICHHPRIRPDCWSDFSGPIELTNDDEDGTILIVYDISCDESKLLEALADESKKKLNALVYIALSKLNETHSPMTYGPEYSFPKTRGDYKGNKIQEMIINPTYLYNINRPLRFAGHIKSQSKLLKRWINGFIVLENGVLSWYKNETLTELKREFLLKDITISYHSDDSTIPPTCVRINASSVPTNNTLEERNFFIKFEENISSSTWISSLQSHQEWANR